MLNITINDSLFTLKPHQSPALLSHDKGDGYGNGSVSWLPDGLFLHEIIDTLCPQNHQQIIGALRNKEILTLESFITSDCSLEWITLGEPLAEQLLDDMLRLLINYVMFELFPQYQRLNSTLAQQYFFIIPSTQPLSAQALASLNERLKYYLAKPPQITTRLENTNKVIRQLAAQKQNYLAQTLLAQNTGEPLYVHKIGENFLDPARLKGMIPLSAIKEAIIDSQEITAFDDFSVLILSARCCW